MIDGINRAQADKKWYAKAGAVVALDPRDGAIRALASYPTFDPTVYTRRRKSELAPLLDPDAAEASNFPALDRAIAGAYPPGSTFKPVTALAAMQEHILSPYNSLPCTGSYTVDGPEVQQLGPGREPDDDAADGARPVVRHLLLPSGQGLLRPPAGPRAAAPEMGEDVRLRRADRASTSGPRRQASCRRSSGSSETFTKETDPDNWQIDRIWKPGDSIQLAIGQKDMLASPLQMARFYALLANGGKLVTPHLVSAIEQGGGSTTGPAQGSLVLRRYQPPAQELNLDPAAIDVIRQGLFEATHSPFGTSSGVFGHFPIPIAGKTGTAEKVIDAGDGTSGRRTPRGGAAAGPYDTPELVVCAVIENGGYGGEIAAPSALQVFEQYFGIKATQVQAEQAD